MLINLVDGLFRLWEAYDRFFFDDEEGDGLEIKVVFTLFLITALSFFLIVILF